MKANTVRATLYALTFIVCAGSSAQAQEIRYSWLDMSFMSQDVGRSGALPTPGIPDQIVSVDGTDGSGIRFRGSFGTWYGLYLVLDYGSTDIDLTGDVTNPGIPPAEFSDEFDYTSIRGGIGYKYSLLEKTDLFLEVTYDSLDFDFGSFAGENFDMNRQEYGGTLGVRQLFGDHLTTQFHARYTGVGDADLTTGVFDSDTLVGLGVYWEIIRGFSLTADFETGEFSSWSIGFRLDLDED